ncbi:hypothetical protein [Massilia aquatica]|nr:hypothetical protein [Massilia aquatica]
MTETSKQIQPAAYAEYWRPFARHVELMKILAEEKGLAWDFRVDVAVV